MSKISVFLFLWIGTLSFGQTYAPAAGQPGSTAIPYDSTCFVAWATHVTVTRGYINISDTTATYQGSNKATFGLDTNAVGPATNVATDAVSLGDSGYAVATFARPITNGQGYDFAVFENGVTDNYLELGLVEVSSDGVHYVRFPAHSATQTTTQIGGFGSVDPTNLYNLAGKYRLGFGTPFDLEDLKDSAGIDITHITHVKIIDCIGSIGTHATYDADGNKINELFPTPFNTGGFDLTGIGVIHEEAAATVSSNALALQISLYPNPGNGTFFIKYDGQAKAETTITIYNSIGQSITTFPMVQPVTKISLPQGIYHVRITQKYCTTLKSVIVY